MMDIARTFKMRRYLGLAARTATDRAEAGESRDLNRHIPSLDGLRGLAVLMVMIFHQTMVGSATALDRSYSWVVVWLMQSGVDLFFVLSGFLITGILFRSKSKSSQNYFRNFYARRVLRIFPLYYAILFVALVILPAFPHPKLEKWGHVSGWNGIWYWLFLSNWSIALNGGPQHGMIDMSWTLSIEEQFYLLWPLLVWVCDRRRLMIVCAALIGLSISVRLALVLAEAPPIWGHMMTPARFDGLAIGSWIALAVRGPGGVKALMPKALWTFPVAVAGLLLIFETPSLEFLRGSLDAVLGGTFLALLYGSLLVFLLGTRVGSPLDSVFAGRFLVLLGVNSYALYLFHNPIQAMIRDLIYGPEAFPRFLGSAMPGQILFYLLASIPALILAMLSQRFFEGPILNFKHHFPS